MTEEVYEFNYTLRRGFSYHFKGQPREAEFITLFVPTTANIGYVGKLKQGMIHALTGGEVTEEDRKRAAEEKEAGNDKGFDDLTGDMIMSMLAMSKDVDYAEYLNTAKYALIAKGIAMVDGEEPMKGSMLDKVTMPDLESMVGEYLKVFILSSVAETLQT